MTDEQTSDDYEFDTNRIKHFELVKAAVTGCALYGVELDEVAVSMVARNAVKTADAVMRELEK